MIETIKHSFGFWLGKFIFGLSFFVIFIIGIFIVAAFFTFFEKKKKKEKDEI